jgi:hypothetical protein
VVCASRKMSNATLVPRALHMAKPTIPYLSNWVNISSDTQLVSRFLARTVNIVYKRFDHRPKLEQCTIHCLLHSKTLVYFSYKFYSGSKTFKYTSFFFFNTVKGLKTRPFYNIAQILPTFCTPKQSRYTH